MGVSVRAFPEMINLRGKTPSCVWRDPRHGLGFQMEYEKKEKGKSHIPFSVFWPTEM